MKYIECDVTCDSPEWCSAEKSSSALKSSPSLALQRSRAWPVAAWKTPTLSCAAEVTSRAALCVNHPECTLPQRHLAFLTCEQMQTRWLSPRDAVAGVGVAAPRAATGTAAVLMQPPVSQHAPVTADAAHTGLTSAFPAAGITRRAGS